MAYEDIDPFASDEIVTAVDQDQLRLNIEALIYPPQAEIGRWVFETQVIPNDTWTKVTNLDVISESADRDGMWNAATSEITFSVDGMFIVNYEVTFDGLSEISTVGYRGARIMWTNGSLTLPFGMDWKKALDNGADNTVWTSGILDKLAMVDAVAGHKIWLEVYQNCGDTLTIRGGRLGARWIGN